MKKQVTDTFDLTQMIKGPTRITGKTQSQIDLVFSNKPERITKSYNMVTGLSDHIMTLIARKLSKHRFKPATSKNPPCFRIPRCSITKYENAIREINWSDCLQYTDVVSQSGPDVHYTVYYY